VLEGDRELVGELLRRLEALLDVPVQRAVEPRLERGRQVRPVAHGVGQLGARDLRERHRDALLGRPHGPRGEALVHDAAQRPEIGPVVDRALAAHLLGAHVGGRPEHRPFAREARLRLAPLVDRRVELREAEIEDLGEELALLVVREEQVFGLEVAVDDAGGVRAREAAAGLRGHRERHAHVDRALVGHPLVERLALEQLEHQERAPVVEAPRVVHVADVGAADGGGGARLAEEALDDDDARGQLLREDLDRDTLADVDVLGLVHGRHPPAAELPRDAVLAGDDGAER
jgi:hypothetical protein